jgi:hypothetical protein
MVVSRSTMGVGLVLFLLGWIVGSFHVTRTVTAQEKPQDQDWVIQQAKENAHFDAYIFNTRTGEAFFVQERTKEPVTLKH